MSYFILNQLRCCRSRINLNKRYGLCGQQQPQQQQVLNYSSTNKDDDGGNDKESGWKATHHRHGLGQTVVLVQQGVDIQELPIIVRHYGENEITTFTSNKIPFKFHQQDDETHKSLHSENASMATDEIAANATNTNSTAAAAVAAHISASSNSTNVFINPVTDCDTLIKILEKCETGENVLQLIASLPEHELESDTLVFAFEKCVRIETMQMLKLFETNNEQYQHLLRHLYRVCDTNTLLNILNQLQSMLYMNQSIDQICDEILIRTADGCLSIMEICEAVHRFVECKRFAGAEKFWAGLSDGSANINENNIKFVFEILPKLKVSRRMVVGILDRRIIEVFPLLKSDAVHDIMEAIKQCHFSGHSTCTLKAITRWLNVNIHAVNETHLEQIVHCLTALNYSDSDLESAIERYMKAKATKVKSQTLIVEMLKHVEMARLINSHILNGCSEFFIKECANIDAGYLRDIVCPFGKLQFQPFNKQSFWTSIEMQLEKNFNKISAVHIVDILLATVSLKLYPVNFMGRVFNRQFMHLLHSRTPMNELPMVRSKLKILDIALTLECNEYQGPLLPRQFERLCIDNRIKQIINDNLDIITSVASGKTSFSILQVPQLLPICNLYAIDILFHPPGLSLHNYNKDKDRNILVAALIHLPEHYDASGKYLIGEQQMRIRHLRHIGLKVVSLQYTVMRKLSMHRKELYEYIAKQLKHTLPAIEPIANE
ncbi:uncharacterized protein LOC116341733 [Contarinia nasturtii]|uniref:uncharacterized protein LOC116341733 n=1 Tax=Contarinia nasturtii TaxID=265458 RepID=UPI0012D408F9|nr:uncharacterized protein LOC116341733 [Contarinia nasturtii]